MSESKIFTVCVFPLDRPGRYIAYLRDYNHSWQGACLHTISAKNGTDAKRIAIMDHKAHCSKMGEYGTSSI